MISESPSLQCALHASFPVSPTGQTVPTSTYARHHRPPTPHKFTSPFALPTWVRPASRVGIRGLFGELLEPQKQLLADPEALKRDRHGRETNRVMLLPAGIDPREQARILSAFRRFTLEREVATGMLDKQGDIQVMINCHCSARTGRATGLGRRAATPTAWPCVRCSSCATLSSANQGSSGRLAQTNKLPLFDSGRSFTSSNTRALRSSTSAAGPPP